MAKSDRLLQLMQCLRTLPAPVRAHALSDELGVSLRTVYRDIAALRRAGALIDGEPGFGYTLQEDPALPPMMFNRDEMEALVLGLREVVEVGDAVLADAAENALSKLKAALPHGVREELAHSVLYAKRFRPRPEVSIDIAALRLAARSECAVHIDYEDEHLNATERTVWPLAIVFFDVSLVLLAWCTLRQAYRTFRIDRIKTLNTLEASFRPKRVPMLREYLETLSESAPPQAS